MSMENRIPIAVGCGGMTELITRSKAEVGLRKVR